MICEAPKPSVVATPITVAIMVMVSIMVAIGPSAYFPKRGFIESRKEISAPCLDESKQKCIK